MFDEVQTPLPRTDQRERRTVLDVSLLSQMELLILRGQIDQRLPPMTLENVNLEQEMLLQFQTAKALQEEAIRDMDSEASKMAAVINACTSALQQIVKLQENVYTAERFKTIESLLMRHLKTLPKETVEAFIEDYSKLSRATS